MHSDQKILLFIPVYNCEKQIGRTLGRITPKIQELFSEILIIDNGSKDLTLHNATLAAKRLESCKVTIIKNASNVNLGGSHKVAFQYSLEHQFTHIAIIHGDDQGDINDLVKYLSEPNILNLDAFLGARFHPQSKLINYSLIRRIGNLGVNSIASLIALKPIFDIGSGLNLFNAKMLKSKFYLSFPNDLTFNCYMLIYFISHKLNFRYFPHKWSEDDQVSNAKLTQMGIKLLRILTLFAIAPSKLMKSNLTKIDTHFEYEVIYTQNKSKN